MLDRDGCRFHHLGLACRDLAKESAAWTGLGYRPEGPIFVDPVQKIRGCFLVGPGPRLELLTPEGEGSPIEGYLARGIKIYHQAFESDAFETDLAALTAQGGKITAGPVPAVAFDGRRIAFVLLPTLNLIELIEAAP